MDAAAAPEPEEAAPVIVHQGLSPLTKSAWLAIGAVSLVVCIWAIARQDRRDMFSISRSEAATIARAARSRRGA